VVPDRIQRVDQEAIIAAMTAKARFLVGSLFAYSIGVASNMLPSLFAGGVEGYTKKLES
jgi:hypothetical protein